MLTISSQSISTNLPGSREPLPQRGEIQVPSSARVRRFPVMPRPRSSSLPRSRGEARGTTAVPLVLKMAATSR